MMEAFALYLLKSVIWLSGFALVYLLFLRNERFFLLNRFFLVSGILISFFFPLITVHYNVEIPAISKIEGGNAMLTGVRYAGHSNIFNMESLLLALYLSGVLFVSFRIIKQSTDVLSSIKKTGIIETHPVKLIRNADYNISFSFFSYVFVNPSVTDLEKKEIVNHELVHIRQKHWVDLLLVELLSILQWFNPLIWVYIRFIRQNHEYLADEVALQQTSDPAVYRATLLNQLAGYPVVSLSNSFNYSLNKKRFKMMKNIVNSPWRKMKIFLILPVFAIVLYAFAKPEYRYNSVNGTPETKNQALTVQNQVVKGTVVQEDGTPLPGASVIVKGTTIGTTTDLKGYFVLDKLPSDAELIVSFVGFQSKVIKTGNNSSEMKITMIKSIVNIEEVKIVPPPPPPPPPLQVRLTGENMKAPLIILDGKVTDIDVNTIPVETIESVNVLPGKEATIKYGATDKDGVILITTKKGGVQISDVPPPPPPPLPGSNGKVSIVEEQKSTDKAAFVVVEEMPSFPGGYNALSQWISSNMKYPAEAAKNNISGQVSVDFMVTWQGKVKDVRVNQPGNPLLDAEAVRVVSNMPDWKPGKQGGKPVAVSMKIPINFSNEKIPVNSKNK
jgi:TonB family protein